MPRGSTDLDSNEYDDYLAKNKRRRELRQRHIARKNAHSRDGKGWHFGIDTVPVKVESMDHLRKELDKRGLALEGEYQRRKR